MGARLASLSACKTGIPGTKLPDEVVSLPSAFIRAGFAGAIGSLWTVPDKSTALLMTSFYQLWRDKHMPPAQALVEAQMQLRAQKEFQHPFYWAAFYMTGFDRINRALAKNSNSICANNFIFLKSNPKGRNASI